MQTDGNSFIGDVVFDSFNMSHRDEDSILDQKYEKLIVFRFIKNLNFKRNERKCICKEIQHITTSNSYNWILVLLLC